MAIVFAKVVLPTCRAPNSATAGVRTTDSSSLLATHLSIMPYIFVDYLRICKVKYPTDINWKCLFCTDHLCETLITGELACGNLKNRQSLLKLWNSLTTLTQASDKEVLYFIEHHQLMGRGTGYVDTHLLASVALATNVRLWTCNKRLAGVASRLNLNHG